jgi:hypothetical protein
VLSTAVLLPNAEIVAVVEVAEREGVDVVLLLGARRRHGRRAAEADQVLGRAGVGVVW